ncbi:hypothetical protein [Mucilaginibacter antarcticus]|uniref:hypothetical protein n=1 Tax=Mucilaginibacter antarcticus TaxID=1855725 RepID=UPI0036289426
MGNADRDRLPKKFVKDINDQLGEITEEILLFLNHVRKITVVRTGKAAVILSSAKKKRPGFELVSIGVKEWRVFRREGLLPSELQDGNKEEKQHFQLKVAYQDDLSDTYRKLFNFFPPSYPYHFPASSTAHSI